MAFEASRLGFGAFVAFMAVQGVFFFFLGGGSGLTLGFEACRIWGLRPLGFSLWGGL